jgi:nucleoside-diphosphate-sugar epimerase
MQLLEYARLYRVESFFNTDTFFNTESFQYDYLNSYTLSKKHFVDWGKNYSSSCDVQFINMKLQHVYGPKDDESKFVSWFVAQLRDEVPEIKLTSGTQKRDFIYVKDVVESYLILLEKRKEIMGFREFEVGTGNSLSVMEFLIQIVNTYEGKYGIKIKSNLKFGALPMRIGEPDETKANRVCWELLQIDFLTTSHFISLASYI